MDTLRAYTWNELFGAVSPFQSDVQVQEGQGGVIERIINNEIPQIINGKRLIGCSLERASFRTGEEGARFEIYPESDPTVAMIMYSATNSEVFKVLIGGDLSVTSLDIPNTTTANSFHVDTSGNIWWGATTIGGATAKVLNTGAATFSDITITGGTFINTAATLAEARLNTLFKKTVFIGAYNDGMTATGDTITRSVVVTALTSAPNWTYLKSTGVGGGCFTKDSEFICQTIVDQTTNQDAFWGVGTSGGGNPQPLNGALTGDHYGFIIDDATIYASNADGTTQTRTDISGSVTFTNYNTYRIVFDAGTSVSFYVNDVLVATHTTNLPDAPDGAGVVIFIGIDSTSGTKSKT
jgi:hypothetical protein